MHLWAPEILYLVHLYILYVRAELKIVAKTKRRHTHFSGNYTRQNKYSGDCSVSNNSPPTSTFQVAWPRLRQQLVRRRGGAYERDHRTSES